MLRAAVIGLGTIAPLHLQYILQREGLSLAAGCDIDPAKRSLLPENIPFYEDCLRMMDEIRPDVVHICLPHYLHAPVSEEAARRGIAVFCEKPMASTYEGACRMAELEEEYGVPAGICLQNRFNDEFIRLKDEIKSGRFGAVRGVRGSVNWFREAGYYAASPWRGRLREAGSGCILNQAIHTLDLMGLLMEEEPLQLRGSMQRLSGYDIEVEDTARAVLEYKDGRRAYFSATVQNHSNEAVELSVLMDKGCLIMRSPYLFHVYEGEEKLLFSAAPCTGKKFYYGTSHARCMESFYSFLEGGPDLYVHARDSLPAMKIYEMIRRSHLAGGRAIRADELA